MAARKNDSISKDAMAILRQRARETRDRIGHKSPSELFTPEELANGAPFYFELRGFIQQLKEARQAADLTLADVSARSGIAVESLSRLETGAQTNPTWKTLGTYAAAVGRKPILVAQFLLPEQTFLYDSRQLGSVFKAIESEFRNQPFGYVLQNGHAGVLASVGG
jgi:transcriptional regulator with XRE-family HTH domain